MFELRVARAAYRHHEMASITGGRRWTIQEPVAYFEYEATFGEQPDPRDDPCMEFLVNCLNYCETYNTEVKAYWT